MVDDYLGFRVVNVLVVANVVFGISRQRVTDIRGDSIIIGGNALHIIHALRAARTKDPLRRNLLVARPNVNLYVQVGRVGYFACVPNKFPMRRVARVAYFIAYNVKLDAVCGQGVCVAVRLFAVNRLGPSRGLGVVSGHAPALFLGGVRSVLHALQIGLAGSKHSVHIGNGQVNVVKHFVVMDLSCKDNLSANLGIPVYKGCGECRSFYGFGFARRRVGKVGRQVVAQVYVAKRR